MITYRDLTNQDASRLRDVDRSESVEGIYRVVNGSLVLDETREEAAAWSEATLTEYITRTQCLIVSGGRAVGAWEADRLVGFASLVTSGVGGDHTLLQLDMLYVSRACRGRGIGRELTERICVAARALGARALYVSATPTSGTVQAYLRMGAELCADPDPTLFAREPEDIHLRLPLP